MLPEMSARKALEIARQGDPSDWYLVGTEFDSADYARALAILAALVDECEARDSDEPDAYATWRAAYTKRRRLERGEEI